MNSPSSREHPLPDFLTTFYPESLFGGFADVDGTIAFYTRIQALKTERTVLLDYGCGRAEYAADPVAVRRELRIFRGKVAHVIGMDIDASCRENPFLDEFRLITKGSALPAENKSVDIVIADFVIEHLPDPEMFFAEARRLLRPGGYLCIRTTNLLSYVGLISKLVPHACHARVLWMAQRGRTKENIFPVLYKCNTVFRLRKWMRKYGFEHACYGYEAAPSYLSFSKLVYTLGVLHQKYATGFVKSTIFAFGRLPSV